MVVSVLDLERVVWHYEQFLKGRCGCEGVLEVWGFSLDSEKKIVSEVLELITEWIKSGRKVV